MKTFVLDTNVILHNPDSLEAFEDNNVIIPIEVLEELDRFKRDHDEKGRNARLAIRLIDDLRSKGKPGKGVKLENGGVLKITTGLDYSDVAKKLGLRTEIVDNQILFTAYMMSEQHENVIFVSKDINARIKGDAIGLKCMDFEKQKIDFDRLYSGWRIIEKTREEIDDFYQSKEVKAESDTYFPNEFVCMQDKDDPKHSAIGRYKEEFGILMPLIHNKNHVMSIRPKNREQAMAVELLLNDDIKLVTLIGQAGTGKTLMALAAGLQKVVKDKAYARLLVSRPVMPLGKDIGFLPGTKEEKLENWMGPIYDNLEYIFTDDKKEKINIKSMINKLVSDQIIEMEAMTFMRGRSIANQFIIIDEAQNLTPHEVKTIISRAGTNTKMILTGDPYQIDNPYLDSASNGLTYCVERMKGQKMYGHVTLSHSERSPLASLAAELL
ncbi:MAG: PhoH family protein [Candidatus Omnitrophica bacterium]|nr:PhoH family protein [Candidatus Omnitrophota bacterium]